MLKLRTVVETPPRLDFSIALLFHDDYHILRRTSRNLVSKVVHIIPRDGGVLGNIENLQLLRAHRDR